MDTQEILKQIDLEIARLEQVKSLLSSSTTSVIKTKRGPKPKSLVKTAAKKRVLSQEARARIAAAQKARWAKAKKATKPA